MSALPPKADMKQQGCDVRFVPKPDMHRSFSVLRMCSAICGLNKRIRATVKVFDGVYRRLNLPKGGG
jgi:hypothetical protein